MPETGTTGVEGKPELVFFVNGRKVVDQDVDPEMTLLTYLRTKCILLKITFILKGVYVYRKFIGRCIS
ncbi:XDH [Branchiostoma lanceolatum]|uniref:XDH protein n=1 Tax=Branchiostoma lanceolatum TaxID=7740 RepID=A0A8S4MP98_BRALA|nr:XDH [Branchiostoma lanceolatum]